MARIRLVRHRQTKGAATDRLDLRTRVPALYSLTGVAGKNSYPRVRKWQPSVKFKAWEQIHGASSVASASVFRELAQKRAT